MSRQVIRRLQKQSYSILDRFTHLEKQQTRERVINYENSDQPLVINILDHLDDAFSSCLDSIPNSSGGRFIESFRRYRKQVQNNVNDSSKPLKGKHLSQLKKQHTKLFRQLLNNNPQLDADCFSNENGDDHLANATWGAVMIWGDSVQRNDLMN